MIHQERGRTWPSDHMCKGCSELARSMTRSGCSQYPRRIPQQAQNTEHVAYAERVTGERERSVDIAHRYGYLREIEHPVTIELHVHANIRQAIPFRLGHGAVSC